MIDGARSDAAKRFGRDYFDKETTEHAGGYVFEDLYPKLRPLGQLWTGLGARKALDIGCAKGALVKALLEAGIDAYGADVSDYAISESPVRHRLSWVDVQSEPLPYPDESFDLVITLETVEHLEHPDRLLREAFRVLQPGGLFYLTTPSIKKPTDTDPTHIGIRPRVEWWRMMREIGFLVPSREARRRFRAAFFRMQYESPYRGRLMEQLRIPEIGSLSRWIVAAYRTQKILRIGRPGTRIFATK